VFARDGVDKSIFDYIEQTKPIYEYVEAQLRKFTDVYCNTNPENPSQFDYKSEKDKERFIAAVRQLMDTNIECPMPTVDVCREDLSVGMFFRGSDPKSWLSSSELALIFKFVDAQDKKESCE
jgi:hypothetical protein